MLRSFDEGCHIGGVLEKHLYICLVYIYIYYYILYILCYYILCILYTIYTTVYSIYILIYLSLLYICVWRKIFEIIPKKVIM